MYSYEDRLRAVMLYLILCREADAIVEDALSYVVPT